LTIATNAKQLTIDRCVVSGLTLGAARPELAIPDDDSQAASDDDSTIAAWVLSLERLLRAWQ
jgi:hypothetical protein